MFTRFFSFWDKRGICNSSRAGEPFVQAVTRTRTVEDCWRCREIGAISSQLCRVSRLAERARSRWPVLTSVFMSLPNAHYFYNQTERKKDRTGKDQKPRDKTSFSKRPNIDWSFLLWNFSLIIERVFLFSNGQHIRARHRRRESLAPAFPFFCLCCQLRVVCSYCTENGKRVRTSTDVFLVGKKL